MITYRKQPDPVHVSQTVMMVRRNNEGTTVTRTPHDIALALPLEEPQMAGEVRIYKMTLPMLPPSKNVYDQWPATWKSSMKKKWVKKIADECEAQAMPRVAQVGLSAVLVFPTRNKRGQQGTNRDVQNYAQALWHWVPDALVQAGVLTDDTAGQVQIGPNWGIKFAYDLRDGLKKELRQRTHLAIAMRVR
jgi:Holliday junction resolvase RusA-like endonuclease